MKVLVQRVLQASVTVDNVEIARIGEGLLALVGIAREDTEEICDKMAKKVAALRIFDDALGVMNLSLKDVGGEALSVSQFTLCANTARGNRPSYINAAGHELAVPLYNRFCGKLEAETGKVVQRGKFGADMKVSLVNNGPVTIILDSDVW